MATRRLTTATIQGLASSGISITMSTGLYMFTASCTFVGGTLRSASFDDPQGMLHTAGAKHLWFGTLATLAVSKRLSRSKGRLFGTADAQ